VETRIVSLAAVALLVGCATLGCASTRIVETWTSPGLSASDLSFQHVVAIAAVPDEVKQRMVEDVLVASATRTKVTAAYTVVNQQDRADPERLRAALDQHGFDGAITVRLVDIEDKESYVPGSSRAYGGGYYGYYGRVGAVAYEPGYYRTDTYVKVETSLYDVAAGELLWVGISETLNPSTVDGLISGIVEAAGKKLRDQGLIP
jgi:hypothetical protein